MSKTTDNLALPLNVHGIQALRQSVKDALEALDGHAKSLVGSSESVTTGAVAAAASLAVYQTKVTTGGTAAAETLNLGNGTGAIVGQRKLITLAIRTNAADSVALDQANFGQGAQTISAIVLDAANEFILAEWQGAKWEVIKASAGVVTAV